MNPAKAFTFLLGECLRREPRAHIPTLRRLLAERLIAVVRDGAGVP